MNNNTNDGTLHLSYKVSGDNFTSAGEASVDVKKALRQLGFDPAFIRRVSIAMYEGEINMAIHADGGTADVYVYPDKVEIILEDKGPGIADISLAMQEGFSTAPDAVRSLGFGAGMGLPNMKRYTDDMKIESEVGVGTKVVMTINVS
jgi:Anti-sigma regulatory factor (Ser/Thr protein kinase)